jgi:hypothetical protein
MNMRAKTILYTVYLLTTVALVHSGWAEGDRPQSGELKQLEQQILELKRLTEEMKQAHEAEIRALKEKIEKLQQAAAVPEEVEAEDELAKLREMAESLAGPKEEEKPPEETVFKFGGLSLQKLNPEISVSGDFVTYYRHQSDTRKRTDAEIRGLELNFQSYLDPFSRLKATTHIHGDHIDVEEVYFTRFSTLGNANLDVGKFRQQFGVVNRWHEDALDQVQYPLALQRIFGDEGLSQTGASLEWTMPKWGDACQELVFQVTNNDNEELFGGDELGTPSLLFHYKNYRDLSRDTYLEFGLSGLFGWNDEWDVLRAGTFDKEHDALGTQVFGADVSFLWEPAERALYRNIEWRSELYVLNRDILAPDGSGTDNVNAWGAYSYLQTRAARNLEVGVRCDYYEPDSKDYAIVTGTSGETVSLAPLVYLRDDPCRWQLSPYITWWQSEWVKFRGEYNYAWGRDMEPTEHVVWFQAVFAAGPHKHERY